MGLVCPLWLWRAPMEPGGFCGRFCDCRQSIWSMSVQILCTIPSSSLPKKMVVGAGDIKEVPLLGFEPIEPDPLVAPCRDRTANGLWSWSVNRVALKVPRAWPREAQEPSFSDGGGARLQRDRPQRRHGDVTRSGRACSATWTGLGDGAGAAPAQQPARVAGPGAGAGRRLEQPAPVGLTTSHLCLAGVNVVSRASLPQLGQHLVFVYDNPRLAGETVTRFISNRI